MSEEEKRWWMHPQGWVATITIAVMVLSFFYVREKQMWETSSRITVLETRGDKAIIQVSTRLERIEQVLGENRDRVNFLERKIDRIELKQAEEEKHQKSYE